MPAPAPAASGTRSVLGYALALFLPRALSLVTVPLVAHALPVEVLGVYTLLSLVLLGHALADLGLGTAALRLSAESNAAASRERIVATLVWGRLIAALVVSVAIASCGRGVALALTGSADVAPLVALVAATLFVGSVTDGFFDVLRSEERHRTLGTFLAVRSVLVDALTILFVVVRREGLLGMVVARLVGYGAGFVVMTWLCRRALRTRPSVAMFREMLRFGAPVATLYAIMSLRAIDRYVLRWFTSTADVGVYGVANRIAGPIALSNTALTYALERRAFVLAEAPDAHVVVGLFFRRYVAIAGAVAFAVSMVGPELVEKLLPSSYHGAIAALPILLFAVVAEGTLRLSGLGADLGKRTRPWALAAVAHLVVSIGATVLLARSLGVVGAALGALAGALVAAWVVGSAAERIFPLGLPLRRTLLFLAAAAVVGVISVGTSRTAPLPLVVRLAMAATCFAMAVRYGKIELGSLARGALR